MKLPRLLRMLPTYLIMLVVVALGIAAVVVFGLRHWSDSRGATQTSAAPSAAKEVASAPSAPTPVAATDAITSAAVPAQISGRDRFAAEEILAVSAVADASGTVTQRVRLVRFAKSPAHALRVVDHLSRDSSTGELSIAQQEIMRADSVVVAVPPGETPESLAARLQAAGFSTAPSHSIDAALTVHLPEASVDAVPAALAAIASVLPEIVVEPNFIYFPSQTTPNDYDAAAMWGLENIEATGAWTVSTGSANVVVAVIDSGISATHPDLAPNRFTNTAEIAGNGVDDDGNGFIDDVHGWDFVTTTANPNGDNDPNDVEQHGTHVSGTIGAVGNNGTGLVGVNWNVRILPLRVGDATFSNAETLNALRYVNALKQRGVNIVAVNASWGGGSFSGSFRTEVLTARTNNILFVAAAGNETANNDAIPEYPAGYDPDNIIAVASINQANNLSSFSNWGKTTVDLAAPGTGIRSTIPGSSYAFFDGTSMATPHVTGACALVAAANPTFTYVQIRDRILQTVEPVASLSTRLVTGGRLNLRRALAPTLARPRVAITTPAADVVAMDAVNLPLSLAATLLTDNGATPTATITWETVEGPTAVQFTPALGATTTAIFSQSGLYRLRARATSGALAETSDLTVAVGGASASSTGQRASWHFEETTGSTAADSSGDGRTGTLTATVSRVTGALGQGLGFNGTNGYASFATPSLTKLTISGWVRADGSSTSSTGVTSSFSRVVHMRDGLLFGGLDQSSVAGDGNAGTLKFALDNGVNGRVWHTPAGTFSLSAWHHVAVTYDSTVVESAPQFYIDGLPKITGVQDGAAGTPSVAAGAGFIGDRGDGFRVWKGALDEIRVYDRVLTPAEVAAQSREVRLRSLLDGTFTADTSGGTLSFPVSFSPAATQIAAAGTTSFVWSVVGGSGVAFLSATSASTTATASAAGNYGLRLDIMTGDRVLVVRTIAASVATTPVTTEGFYTGTTSSGGTFVLFVRSDGTSTFLAGGDRGRYARSFTVAPWGSFTFTDRMGANVTGQVNASGGVTGTIGATTFTGARATAGAADAVRDGVYAGWILDTGIRAEAVVAGGRVAIVVEESGAATSASGSFDNTGAFSLVPQSGASFAGTIASGLLQADVLLPSHVSRRIVLLREGFSPARRLVNISMRGLAGQGSDVLIAGFVLDGSTNLPVLVRGVGPGLGAFGILDALQVPRLTLQSGSTLLAQNDGWDLNGNGAAITAAETLTNAFFLSAASHDDAVLVPLSGGSYTAQIAGSDGGSGTALAEIYDARQTAVGANLINVSARGRVGTGDNIMIGGFVIGGDAPMLVLARAAGPGLVQFGVTGTLAQPMLTIFRGSTVLASGAAWGLGDSPSDVSAAATSVSAFSFANGSTDAGMLLFLSPGAYTAQVSGAGNTTGVALMEIYQVADF